MNQNAVDIHSHQLRRKKALGAIQSTIGLVLLAAGVSAQFGAAYGVSVAGFVLLAAGVWGLR